MAKTACTDVLLAVLARQLLVPLGASVEAGATVLAAVEAAIANARVPRTSGVGLPMVVATVTLGAAAPLPVVVAVPELSAGGASVASAVDVGMPAVTVTGRRAAPQPAAAVASQGATEVAAGKRRKADEAINMEEVVLGVGVKAVGGATAGCAAS